MTASASATPSAPRVRTWVDRFIALYAFNVLVLLAIGWLTPARVGWAAVGAAIVLTLIELFVTPLIRRLFARLARSERGRSKTAEWFAQVVVSLAVAFTVWVLTLWLTDVDAGGSWFWAWVLPPVVIAVGWLVYAKAVGRFEAGTGELYDRAERGIRGDRGSAG